MMFSVSNDCIRLPVSFEATWGGGDAPRERAMFWLLDAVGGLLGGEKLLRERGDPVGDRLLCEIATGAATGRRWLRDLSDEFAYFRDAYRFFRS